MANQTEGRSRGRVESIVQAVDVLNPEMVHSLATRARVESSAAVAGSRVYIGSSDGRFYVLDLNTGKLVWEYESGAPMTASPAIANGVFVIGTTDGTIIGFGG